MEQMHSMDQKYKLNEKLKWKWMKVLQVSLSDCIQIRNTTEIE